jgi:MFS transporter, OFA family, oxalate/formate antiporter
MGTPGIEKRPIFYGWWIVLCGFLLLFLYAGAGFYSFSIFIHPLETDFGWSRSQISLAMTIYLVVNGIMAPFIGYMTERFGPRRIMTLFVIGFGVSFILVSLTQTLWHFYLAYTLIAFTSAGVGFVPVSAILARWFTRRRGTALGLSMVGISVGGLVMSPFIEYMNTSYSWRTAFVFMGILVWVVGLPVTLFFIKGSPRDMGLLPDNDLPEEVAGDSLMDNFSEQDTPQEDGWPLKAALKSRFLWSVIATFILAPAAQMGVLQHQMPLITGIGVSGTVAAAALGFTAGLGGVGKMSFGRISELLPVQFAALLCFGLQALGVLILYNASSMVSVWAYVFIFGFAMGGNIVLLPIVVGHYFGLASFGVILGVVTFFQALGAGSGAIISGLVYDFTGSYEMALQLYVGLYALAVVAIFSAGRPREYQPDA